MIQPLAYVHPDAKIAKNVVIEPFTTISKNVLWRERVFGKTAKFFLEL